MAALREILAEFDVKVQDKALEQADKHLDRLKESVGEMRGRFSKGLGGIKGVGKGLGSEFSELGGAAEGASGELAEMGGAFGGVGVAAAAGAAAVAAFVVGAIAAAAATIHMTMGLAENADVLSKQSAALGISIEELQQYQYAADLANVPTDALTAALARLQRGAAEFAETGKGPAAEGLKAVGVAVTDASGNVRSAGDLFEDFAENFSKMEDPAKRNAAAAKVFGKNFFQLVPLLQGGSEEIEKAKQELQDFGAIIGQDFASASEEMNDNITRLGKVWLGLKLTVGKAVLPLLVGAVEKLLGWAKAISVAVRRSGLFRAAMSALTGAGSGFISRALKPLIRLLKYLAVAILSPVLLLDELVTFFQGGDTLIGRWLEKSFGKGSSQKVRDFVSGAYEEVQKLFGLYQTDPEAFGREVARLLQIAKPYVAKGVDALVDIIKEKFPTWIEWIASMLPTWTLLLVSPFTAMANVLADVIVGIFKDKIAGFLSNPFGFGGPPKPATPPGDAAAPGAGGSPSKPAALAAPSIPIPVKAALAAANPMAGPALFAPELVGAITRLPAILTGFLSAPKGATSVTVNLPGGTPAATQEAARRGAAAGVREAESGAKNRAAKSALQGG